MLVLTSKQILGFRGNIRVPLATRARIPCLVHAMAESTAFAALGEHAAFHVGGVFKCPAVSEDDDGPARMFVFD